MRLVVIEQGRMARIVSLSTGLTIDVTEELSSVEEALAEFQGHGGSVAKAAAGMLALFNRFAEHGRIRSVRLFHEASKHEGIYEFIKGDLRVYFFFSSDSGEVVVCSHAIRKKRQRVDPGDVDRAAALKKRYLAAQAVGEIEYIMREKKP